MDENRDKRIYACLDMIRDMHRHLNKCINYELIDVGIKITQLLILKAVNENPEYNLTQLAECLRIERSTCSRCVKTLINSKLLQKNKLKRNNYILTTEGNIKLNSGKKVYDYCINKLRDIFDLQSHRNLEDIIKKINKPLEGYSFGVCNDRRYGMISKDEDNNEEDDKMIDYKNSDGYLYSHPEILFPRKFGRNRDSNK